MAPAIGGTLPWNRRGTAGGAKSLLPDLVPPKIRGKFVLVYFIVFNSDLKEEM